MVNKEYNLYIMIDLTVPGYVTFNYNRYKLVMSSPFFLCYRLLQSQYLLAHLAEGHGSLWYGAVSVRRPSGVNFFL